MGAVQRLATVVIVGLVALSTILVLVIADESNRIDAEEKEQEQAAIERAKEDYLSLCLSCHGPAGEGYTAGDGRIGMPLNTTANQLGVNAAGTPVSGGLEARADIIRDAIHNGRPNTAMPAWGEEKGGPLNDEQIEEFVVFIQHVDWNEVYNEAVEAAGGAYPTVIPTATQGPDEGGAEEQPSEPNTYNVSMGDNFFEPAELVLPANTDVTINVTNDGVGVHRFDLDELDVHSGDVPSGESVVLQFNTGGVAEYEYYCSVPGHRESGMVGRLVVTDDPALLPQPATDAREPAEGVGEGDAPVPSPNDPESTGANTTFDVEMVDTAFIQPELTVPANTEITINLVNNGVGAHNFTLDELQVSSGNYESGQSGTFTFNSGEPGVYEFYCSIPGHKEAGMVGTLTVQ